MTHLVYDFLKDPLIDFFEMSFLFAFKSAVFELEIRILHKMGQNFARNLLVYVL